MSMETRDHPAAAQAAGGVTPEETVSPADNETPDGTDRTETTAEAVPTATGTAVPDSAAGADVLPEADALVRAGGRTYRVQRAERLFFADETLYVWGLLRETGGTADA